MSGVRGGREKGNALLQVCECKNETLLPFLVHFWFLSHMRSLLSFSLSSFAHDCRFSLSTRLSPSFRHLLHSPAPPSLSLPLTSCCFFTFRLLGLSHSFSTGNSLLLFLPLFHSRVFCSSVLRLCLSESEARGQMSH